MTAAIEMGPAAWLKLAAVVAFMIGIVLAALRIGDGSGEETLSAGSVGGVVGHYGAHSGSAKPSTYD
jgi:hypothetical protein